MTPAPALDTSMVQGPGTGQILLMVFYLAAILVGVYYATRLFARIAQGGMGKSRASGARRIKMIDRLMLDKDKSVALIEEGGKRYLIGVTTNSISVLKEEDAPLQEEVNDAERKPASFSSLLRAMKDRGKP